MIMGVETNLNISRKKIARDQMLEILRQHSEELDQFGVKSLALFGSVARNEHGPGSDVDILVEFDSTKHVGLLAFIRLQHRLEEILGTPVDLATQKALKRQLRDRILKEAVYAV
jgi:predicted nucleotidyltransferase